MSPIGTQRARCSPGAAGTRRAGRCHTRHRTRLHCHCAWRGGGGVWAKTRTPTPRGAARGRHTVIPDDTEVGRLLGHRHRRTCPRLPPRPPPAVPSSANDEPRLTEAPRQPVMHRARRAHRRCRPRDLACSKRQRAVWGLHSSPVCWRGPLAGSALASGIRRHCTAASRRSRLGTTRRQRQRTMR